MGHPVYSPVCLDAVDRENFYHTAAEVVFVASPLQANLCFFSQNVCMLYACCHRLLILSHMNLFTASCVKIFHNTCLLISNFRHVLNVVCFLLGDSPASEIYMLTFRNTRFHLHRQVGVCRMN